MKENEVLIKEEDIIAESIGQLEENKRNIFYSNLGYAYNVLNRVINGYRKLPNGMELEVSGEVSELQEEMNSNSDCYNAIRSNENLFNMAKSRAKLKKIYKTEKETNYSDIKDENFKITSKNIKTILDKILKLRQIDEEEEYNKKLKEATVIVTDNIVDKIIDNITPFYIGVVMEGVLVDKTVLTTKPVPKSEDNIYVTHKKDVGDNYLRFKELDEKLATIYDSDFRKSFIFNEKGKKTIANYISYKSIHGTDESGENGIKNNCSYFPRFQLAIATGVKGLFAPLTEWMVEHHIDKVEKIKDIKTFLLEYLPKLLVRVLNEGNLWDRDEDGVCLKSNGMGYKFALNEFSNALINSVAIVRFNTNFFYEIRISNTKNMNESIINKLKKENGALIKGGDNFKITPESNGTSFNKTIANIVLTNNLKAFSSMPTFAYSIVDSLVKEGIKWNDLPIGKDIFGNIKKVDFASNQHYSIPLIAGSRSGKGVTTLTFVANAMACGFPVLYFDCKPDMGANFYRMVNAMNTKEENGGKTIRSLESKYNIVAVDGNGSSEENEMYRTFRFEGKLIDARDYILQQLKVINPKIEEFMRNKIASFTDVIMYLRGIEVLYDFVEYRKILYTEFSSKQEDDGVEITKLEEVIKLPRYNDKYGFKAIPRLVFIFDEIQQYSKNFADWFETETTVNLSDTTKKPIKKMVNGEEVEEYPIKPTKTAGNIGKIMEISEEYAKKIQNWAIKVPDKFNGQFLTQSAGVSGVNIFTIAQKTPLQNQQTNFYGKTIGKWEELLVRKAEIAFWGNETIGGAGSSDDLNPTSHRAEFEDKWHIKLERGVGSGKFIVSEKGNGLTPVNTFFMIAKLTDGKEDSEGDLHNDLTGMLGRIGNAREKVEEEILTEDKKSIKEFNLGFRGYVNTLLERQGTNFAEMFTKGYDILDEFCKDFYGKNLMCKLCDVTDFNVGELIDKYKDKIDNENKEKQREQNEEENRNGEVNVLGNIEKDEVDEIEEVEEIDKKEEKTNTTEEVFNENAYQGNVGNDNTDDEKNDGDGGDDSDFELTEDEEEKPQRESQRREETTREPERHSNNQYGISKTDKKNLMTKDKSGNIVLGKVSNGLQLVEPNDPDFIVPMPKKENKHLRLDKMTKKGVFKLGDNMTKELIRAIGKRYKNRWAKIRNLGFIDNEVMVNNVSFNASAITKGQALYNVIKFDEFKFLGNLTGLGMDMNFLKVYATQQGISITKIMDVVNSMFSNYKSLNVVNIKDANGDYYKYTRIDFKQKLIEDREALEAQAQEMEALDIVDNAMKKNYSSGNKGQETIETINKKEGNVFKKDRKGLGIIFGGIGDVVKGAVGVLKFIFSF